MPKDEMAVSWFKEGFNCSQALLATYGEQFGLNRELALKVSSVFGAGMGMGGTCGAVTGALMIIGAKYGNTEAGDSQSTEMACGLANDFIEEFLSRNKSIECKELIGCDLATPKGIKRAMETGVLTTVCSKFVKDAAEILEQTL